MAKKRKSKKMEKKLLYYFLEQQRHNNLGLTTMDSEVMPGFVHHVKAAHQAEAQQASDDSEQLKWLLMCFKEQQHCIGELEEELVRANKKIKSLQRDVEFNTTQNDILNENFCELDRKVGSLRKVAKKRKAETKQLEIIVKSIGYALRICKMSDSLGKTKDKFLDASSEVKALRRKGYDSGKVMKIIDADYREVPQ